MRGWLKVLVGTGLCLFTTLQTYASENKQKRKLAVTDLSQVDGDFVFQGEYSGSLLSSLQASCDGPRRTGLQVVALGDGDFSAVAYPGGLPGGGWFGGENERLSGTRAGDVLALKNENLAVEIRNRRATLTAPSGQVLGELRKVRRRSRSLDLAPAPGALVLFDGTGTDQFKNAKTTGDGLLQVGTELKPRFQDFMMHLEFRLPYMPYARGQGRANSGVYLQSRYEVQILDSFGLEGKFNECAALYRYREPDVNMCFPPLAWQTYDIYFRSPRFDCAGNKVCNARLTVYHNGVAVHNDFEVQRKTGAGRPESPELLPIKLQNHGNPVHFRNIWLVEYDVPTTTWYSTGRTGLFRRLGVGAGLLRRCR